MTKFAFILVSFDMLRCTCRFFSEFRLILAYSVRFSVSGQSNFDYLPFGHDVLNASFSFFEFFEERSCYGS